MKTNKRPVRYLDTPKVADRQQVRALIERQTIEFLNAGGHIKRPLAQTMGEIIEELRAKKTPLQEKKGSNQKDLK